jgi:hypothetical protein
VEVEVIVGVGRRDVDGDGEVGSVAALVDEGGGGKCVGDRGGCEKGCQKNVSMEREFPFGVYSLVRNRYDASQMHKREPRTEGMLKGR